MFWIAAILLICLAAGFPVLALLRPARTDASPETAGKTESPDMRFYREQLQALDRDVARSVISADEAKSAKVEISRRLLDADRRASQRAGEGAALTGKRPLVAALAAAAILALTAGLYQHLGAAGLADQPLAKRLDAAEVLRLNRPSQRQAEAAVPARPDAVNPEHLALVERLRTALEARPDDLRGHVLLAGNEARLGSFANAARAQVNVIRIKGTQARAGDYADLADLMVLAAGGFVSPEAETALRAALDLDAENGAARYYTGLLFAQNGRADLAFSWWRGLLEQGPSDAPWVPAIRADIVAAARLAGVRYELPPEPTVRTAVPTAGPGQDDIDAAAEMSAPDRNAMIAGMVAGLDARLAQYGGSVEEWVQLIVARTTLGEHGAARDAVARARENFAGDSVALAQIAGAAGRITRAETGVSE